MRRRVSSHDFAGLAIVASAVALGATAADAEASTNGFAIPRQAAGSALIRLAQQAGIQILSTRGDTVGRFIGPLFGRMTIGEALRRAAVSGGLTVLSFDGRTAVIIAAPEARATAGARPSELPGPRTVRRSQGSARVAVPPERPMLSGIGPGDGEVNIVVIGTRLGADVDDDDVKRRALQSVSTLTADDIQRNPDTSVGNVLRRLPGVQVTTNAGGATIKIRGLSETEDRINGRNLTSTIGRGYDIAALPSDLVASVDVYKTPSASQIEGGIGGVVDLRTRRPFDYAGFAATMSAKGGYSSLQGTTQPYLSGFASDRWTTGIGEVGLLVGGAFQRQGLGQHVAQIDSNAFRSVADRVLDAPTDATKLSFSGLKQVATGYGSAQWKPAERLLLTADLVYNRQALDFTTRALTVDLADAIPVSLSTYDGSTAVRSGTWSNAPLTSSTAHDDARFETYQAGLNGRYGTDRLTLSAEASYTHTTYRSLAPSLSLTTTAPAVSLDTGGTVPNFVVVGTDPARLDGWRYGELADFRERDRGTEMAYRADAIYAFDGPIRAIKVGARIDRRTAGSIYGAPSYMPPAGIAEPDALVTDLIDGNLGVTQSRWIAPRVSSLKTYPDALRRLFGVPTGLPPYQAAHRFDAVEKVANGYAETTFGFPLAGVAVDGNAGIRYVHTALSIGGARSLPDGSLLPLDAHRSYHRWLPSLNIRAELVPDIYVRWAYARQLSRPSFSLLSPTLSLDFRTRRGVAGNPGLEPLEADQYDTSFEWYFARDSHVYVAAFYKSISGLVQGSARPETIAGQTYQITRPENLSSTWIAGGEAGYRQRFTFLPGALSGLGLEASYTFVADCRPTTAAGYRASLEGLARHSYVLAGSYERHGFSANLAWVWNSRTVLASVGDDLGRPLYLGSYGQLDGGVEMEVTPRVSLLASAVNLLTRRTISYFLDRRYFSQSLVEDRRILAGVRITLGASRSASSRSAAL